MEEIAVTIRDIASGVAHPLAPAALVVVVVARRLTEPERRRVEDGLGMLACEIKKGEHREPFVWVVGTEPKQKEGDHGGKARAVSARTAALEGPAGS